MGHPAVNGGWVGDFRFSAVVSHISRKTSEIWGTRGYLRGDSRRCILLMNNHSKPFIPPFTCSRKSRARDDKVRGGASMKERLMEKTIFIREPLSLSSALPFVISTEAKRSGEISVLMRFPGNVFLQTGAQRSDLRLFSVRA